jgi:hypothetical protein
LLGFTLETAEEEDLPFLLDKAMAALPGAKISLLAVMTEVCYDFCVYSNIEGGNQSCWAQPNTVFGGAA